jgi:indole-3-glycerol phosphate synthase
MTILDQIIENKRYEVEKAKSLTPIEKLIESQYFNRKGNSLFDSLNPKSEISNPKSGIISEFKRKSPSKGNINIGAGVAEVTSGYTEAGASGLSVLTDTTFFYDSDSPKRFYD